MKYYFSSVASAYFIVPENGLAKISMLIENSLNNNVTLQWQQHGKLKMVDVPSLDLIKTRLLFDISKPGSVSPVEFIGFEKDSKERVDLNGFESISITPSVDDASAKILISSKAPVSFIIINVINDRDIDAYVTWDQGDVKKALLVPNRSSRLVELRFYGKQASPISISGMTIANGIEQKILLNGSAVNTVYPRKEKKVTTLVIGKKIRYLNVEFVNNVAGDIILLWKIGNESKDLMISRGDSKSLNLVLDEAYTAVVFSAVINGEPISLNGKETLQILASSKTTVNRVIANRQFRMDLEVQNRAAGDVILSWIENGLKMTKVIPFKSTNFIKILTKGPMADKPVIFRANLREKGFPVLVNDQVTIELKPEVKKRTRIVVLSPYRLELINEASSDVMVELQLGPDMQMLRIPFGRRKVTNVKFDTFVHSLTFKGYNIKTNRKVQFNNSLNYELSIDSNLKYIQLVITDGK